MESVRLPTLLLALSLLASPTLAAPSITVAFSPNAGATQAVVGVIGEARHTIRLAAYGFTSRPIAAALVQAHRHGVDVRVVLDKSNATARYSAATFLTNAGIPVRIDYRYAIMHDNFAVIDDETVETGSFNYTKSAAEKNAENVVVMRKFPATAATYEKEWDRLWLESESWPVRAPSPSDQ